MGSIFVPNNKYWWWSRTNIINGALPEADGILACMNGRANKVAVSESHEIAWVASLGKILSIGCGRAIKL